MEIELFHGPVSPQVAYVFARVAELPGGSEWRLEGWLRGPSCRWSKTLPATTQFSDLGSGPTLLAKAVLADPCPWSPQLPARYQVQLDVVRGGQTVVRCEREFGMRSLGAGGRSLYWSGKRWVLRGISAEHVASRDWSGWRECGAAMIVDRPDEATCQEASDVGVVMVARVHGKEEEVCADLQRLAQWPAVAAAWIPATVMYENLRDRAPNLMLAASLADPNAELPAWAHLLVVQGAGLGKAAEFVHRYPQHPCLAWRPLAGRLGLEAARTACDRLQSDLAIQADLAGYLV